MTDRVVLFEQLPQGALAGASRGDRLVAGGFAGGPVGTPSTITIDPFSGNIVVATTTGGSNLSLTAVNQIVLNGTTVLINSDVDVASHKIHNVANPTSPQDVATKSYVDTAASNPNFINKDGSVAFTGDESMGNNKLINLGAPTTGTDATNKTYVDGLDTGNIKKNGSVAFTGDESMGGFKLTNVAAPAATTDATNKTYVDTQEALDLRLDGSRIMTGALDMNTHLIHNVVDPVVAQDAATKNYVDANTGGANGLSLTFSEINYTGGVQGFTTIADVTGVTISFVLAAAGTVQFFGSGASLANPFIQGNYLGLAIDVNGTDYFLNGTGEQGFNAVGGGNVVVSGFTTGDAISGQRTLSLSAGAYTVKLRAFGNGYLESSASFPTRLTAVYPTVTGAISTASPLTSQATGPFAATFNPPLANTYDPIPSSSISVVLAAPQTVMLLAYTTFVDTGSNNIVAQLGVRVTSPGPSVVDYDGGRIFGGNDVNADVSSLSRAVSLGAGTHTIELIAKSAGGASYQYENAFLTTVYTTPQAVQPLPPSQIAEATSSQPIAGAYALLPGMTLTPTAGTYLVWFSGVVLGDGSNVSFVDLKIRSGGVDVAASSRTHRVTASVGDGHEVSSMAKVVVSGSQAIDVQAQKSTGTPTIEQRQLMILQVS